MTEIERVLPYRGEIFERFAHLQTLNTKVTGVYKVIDPLLSRRPVCFRLSELVVVMWKFEIYASAVDVYNTSKNF